MTWWTKTTAMLGMAWQWVTKMHKDYPKTSIVADTVFVMLVIWAVTKAW